MSRTPPGRMGGARRKPKRAALIIRDGRACHWCHRELEDHEITIDHLLARGLGGVNALYNLVIACDPCNKARSGEQQEQAERQGIRRAR